MPTSSPVYLSRYGAKLLKHRPALILDVGCGLGKNGVLAREYSPEARIRGIEIWSEYVGALHRAVYDEIEIRDARELICETAQWNLIVMTDVLEHLPAVDGHALLAWIARSAERFLVTTPAAWFQNPRLANPYERHVSFWTRADLQNYGAVTEAPPLWILEER